MKKITISEEEIKPVDYIIDIIKNEDTLIEDSIAIVKAISDVFESYKCDIGMLNYIINIVLKCCPDSKDLQELEIDNLNKLIKIAKDETY